MKNLKHQTCKQIWDQSWDQARKQIYNQAWFPAQNQISYRMWSPIWILIRDQIASQIKNQLR